MAFKFYDCREKKKKLSKKPPNQKANKNNPRIIVFMLINPVIFKLPSSGDLTYGFGTVGLATLVRNKYFSTPRSHSALSF